MANRIRRCSTKKEFEQLIDDYVTQGYTVKSQGENNALVVKEQKKDHLKIALLTVWWTFGIGNIIYALMPAKIEDEVMIKIENS